MTHTHTHTHYHTITLSHTHSITHTHSPSHTHTHTHTHTPFATFQRLFSLRRLDLTAHEITQTRAGRYHIPLGICVNQKGQRGVRVKQKGRERRREGGEAAIHTEKNTV